MPADPVDKLLQSARSRELVAIIGSGVSIALTNNRFPALSWKGLVGDGLDYAAQKGKLTASQSDRYKANLASDDLDELLVTAEFMGRKLDAPNGELYARWLEHVFQSVEPDNAQMAAALQRLVGAGIPLCTLNYDTLLEKVTGLPAIKVSETPKVAAWVRRETAGILHLHGIWDDPPTCILGVRDYETTLRDEVRDLLQRELAAFRRLLFIGCGATLSDPNLSALIDWLRRNIKAAALEHYALVKEDEVAERHKDPAWHGFVEPLSYGPKHSDLPAFLLDTFQILSAKTAGRKPRAFPQDDRLLSAYREFLLRDCGQMTIEGVRADIDTTQRRFDLERLFVPLELVPTPPDIPENDPERDRKLLAWREANKDPRPFSEVFAAHPCLALLALPGGGKSLLLKRLAVAYADPARRTASNDNLPALDVVPVLIRCREWRQQIHLPIPTLLKSLPDITGSPSLAGLDRTLLTLFKKGRALLLIDGLDEIHDDALRTTFVDHLETFLRDYPATRLIVTSREVGFPLVAPTLARFCARWRIAPLNPARIADFSLHWHRLMLGDSPQSEAEAREAAERLTSSPGLRNLAENPLLLTMLLVVKHGAGRLPPDRVTLYSRAVEVLLDTWNIKGHTPLNPKEAVPQLAFVAFRLMQQRKQTATESEFLALLEEARDQVPQIRRYATDTPQAFLKRVELRSSLVVEGGRQREGNATVPFYQFRHLTFQEYLAAEAAAEGHHSQHGPEDTVLTRLQPYLLADEWKEVIPMAAVLARKQADPLIKALVEEGGKIPLPTAPLELSVPVSRLLQCLVEEAEASQETIVAALRFLALVARGCHADRPNWVRLCRGIYGEELFHQAWLLFSSMQWPDDADVGGTCAVIAAKLQSESYWTSPDGKKELLALLDSDSPEAIGRGLFTCIGLGFQALGWVIPRDRVEPHMFQDSVAIWCPAVWADALAADAEAAGDDVNPRVLDHLLTRWLTPCTLRPCADISDILALALSRRMGMPRRAWQPVLSAAQMDRVRSLANVVDAHFKYGYGAACTVAWHNRQIWSREELIANLKKLPSRRYPNAVRLIRELGNE